MRRRGVGRRACVWAILCVCLVAASCSQTWAGPALDEELPDLFKDDEPTLLKYLRTHRVPHHEIFTRHLSFTEGLPFINRELERGLELFRKASSRLRLAIAKSLHPPEIVLAKVRMMEFWDLCGPEDFETRHYLAKKCAGDAWRRKDTAGVIKVRDWVLGEAHPGYARSLFRGGGPTLFARGEKPSADVVKRILRFLTAVYRETGVVYVILPDVTDVSEKMYPARLAARVRLQTEVLTYVPRTPRGVRFVFECIIRDRKTMDDLTLSRYMGWFWRWAPHHDPALIGKAVDRRELAEAYALCCKDMSFPRSHKKIGPSPSLLLRYRQNVWRQVFNPDPRVRERLLRGRLFRMSNRVMLAYLKRYPAQILMRRRVAADARRIVKEEPRWRGSLPKFLAALLPAEDQKPKPQPKKPKPESKPPKAPAKQPLKQPAPAHR